MSKRKDKDAPAPDEQDAPAKGGRKKKLLIGAVALVVLGGGYTVAGPKGADAAAEEAEPAEPLPGEVVVLEPITLNLADGRFLKIGLAMQLVEGVVPPAEDAVAGYAAPALDDAISYLGSKTYAELVAPGGRDAAKDELSVRIAEQYPDEVLSVYFTELVMQ